MDDLKPNFSTDSPPQFEVNNSSSFEHTSPSNSPSFEDAPPNKKDVNSTPSFEYAPPNNSVPSFEYASPRKRPRHPKQAPVVFVPPALGIQLGDGIPLQESAKRLYLVLIGFARELKKYVGVNYHPKVLFEKINALLGNKLEHRDLIFGSLGLVIGGLVGYWLAVALCGRTRAYICMQAVQCFEYSGVEGVYLTDDAVVPKDCGKDEVLVSVKAGTVDVIDVNICSGYGSALRTTLKRNFKYWRKHLPITLGRSCTGVVVDIGEKVTRLELGDEVWLTSPFWAPGVLSQHVLSPEWYVAKKPKRIGFESASSLPYAGGLALSALRSAKITPENADTKRVLVHGGCSSVGCILTQILKLWNAKLTVTCYERAVPVAKALGVRDIIELSVPEGDILYPNREDCIKLLKKELDIREPFDSVIIASECDLNGKELRDFCRERGAVVSTLPQRLRSDNFGCFLGAVLSLYVRSKCLLQNLFRGRIGGFGEAQVSHVELDQLAELVERGDLLTVVEKVFQPYYVEQALTHVQSVDPIGSCVITFR